VSFKAALGATKGAVTATFNTDDDDDIILVTAASDTKSIEVSGNLGDDTGDTITVNGALSQANALTIDLTYLSGYKNATIYGKANVTLTGDNNQTLIGSSGADAFKVATDTAAAPAANVTLTAVINEFDAGGTDAATKVDTIAFGVGTGHEAGTETDAYATTSVAAGTTNLKTIVEKALTKVTTDASDVKYVAVTVENDQNTLYLVSATWDSAAKYDAVVKLTGVNIAENFDASDILASEDWAA
jgi:hypothetical protein